MANKLTFGNYLHRVNINGVDFDFDVTDTRSSDILFEYAGKLQELEKSGLPALEQGKTAIALFTDVIDTILGKGATDKIMHDQNRESFFPYLDTIAFLSDEIREYKSKKMKAYGANRYQRHPASKK